MKVVLFWLAILTFASSVLILPKSFKNKLEANLKDVEIYSNTANKGQIAGVDIVSGYATVDKSYGSALYYLYNEATNLPPQATVIWLNGGPGCSSLSGALMEQICPIQVADDGETTFRRPNSWADRYGLLFIDQPVGTGYSTRGRGPYRKSTWESAKDFEIALENIKAMHPEWFQRDLYIFGESYAGHYIPTYAYTLIKSGKWSELKGIGVGDGLHDGYNQLSNNAIQAFSLGLVSEQQFQTLKDYEQAGRDALSKKDYLTAGEAFGNITGLIVEASGVNPYNSRQFAAPDMPNENMWLNSAQTKRLLGVPQSKEWNMCDNTVNGQYASDIMLSYVDFFSDLLSSIRVLLYCGQDDIIINAASWEVFIKNLKWDGADDFNKQQTKPWYVGDSVSGYFKQHQNLTQLIVLKSGHMVPQDQPPVSREMLRIFVDNLNWSD